MRCGAGDERGTAAILMYHRLSVSIVDPREALYTIAPLDFEAHLRVLNEESAEVVDPARWSEDGPLPPRAVVLTFDDGCRSDFEVALPMLERCGAKAAFFVSPALLGTPGYLSWNQLEALADAGMLVGSHGLDHRLLDGLEEEELERQLAVSKDLLERRLGIEIRHLSLPGGAGGWRMARIARSLGYRFVLGSRPGLARPEAALGLLPRIAIKRRLSLQSFRSLVRRERAVLFSLGARYHALRLARRTMGSRLYERLHELASAGEAHRA